MVALTHLPTNQKFPSLLNCLCHMLCTPLPPLCHVNCVSLATFSCSMFVQPHSLRAVQGAEIHPMRLRTCCLRDCVFFRCHSWNPDQSNASNKPFQKRDERKGKVAFILLHGWPASGRISLTSQAHGKSCLRPHPCFAQVIPRNGILIGRPSV